jgi:hypothetical protein
MLDSLEDQVALDLGDGAPGQCARHRLGGLRRMRDGGRIALTNSWPDRAAWRHWSMQGELAGEISSSSGKAQPSVCSTSMVADGQLRL